MTVMRTTQITRMNNNRWAVVLGNGYNSANQRPVLLVQYLDGAKELLRMPVTTDACRYWQGQ
jgi:type IV pilus assembly protein PilY1